MIPKQREIYNPILKMAAESEMFTFPMAFKWLGDHFDLTDKEREERLRSGQRRFDNKVRWAVIYLGWAGLLTKVDREYKITEQGKRAHEHGDTIDNRYLMQYPSFREIRERRGTRKRAETSTESGVVTQASEVADAENPHEGILQSHTEINAALSADLLDRVLARTPEFFEGLIIDLLRAIYDVDEDAGLVLGRSGDGGIDGVVNQDPLGLDQVYVQAKRYTDHNVQSKEIRDFSGALQLKNARKGIFFTTSSFTPDAKKNAERLGIRTVDGEELAILMVRYNIGCRVENTLEIKKVDEDFFSED